jgi:hypothetical protein
VPPDLVIRTFSSFAETPDIDPQYHEKEFCVGEREQTSNMSRRSKITISAILVGKFMRCAAPPQFQRKSTEQSSAAYAEATASQEILSDFCGLHFAQSNLRI